jgi:hypothetical protein
VVRHHQEQTVQIQYFLLLLPLAELVLLTVLQMVDQAVELTVAVLLAEQVVLMVVMALLTE